MKVRKGFISNSSTTSFLVIYRELTKSEKEHDVFSWDDIYRLITIYLRCEDNEIETGKENLLHRFSGDLKEKLEKAYNDLTEDQDIAYIEVDQHVPIIKELIKTMKCIKVIDSWND